AAARWEAVAAALAGSGLTLVSYIRRSDRLVGLVVRDGAARMVGLGRYDVAEEAQRRLLGDLDALAGRRLPDRLATVVHASARRQVEVLNAELLAPLAGQLGSGGGGLVPTPALSALPWGVVPELGGPPGAGAPAAAARLGRRAAVRRPARCRPGRRGAAAGGRARAGARRAGGGRAGRDLPRGAGAGRRAGHRGRRAGRPGRRAGGALRHPRPPRPGERAVLPAGPGRRAADGLRRAAA